MMKKYPIDPAFRDRNAICPSAGKLAVALALACATLSVFAERQAFERYQTVVDRQMFGPPPEGFDPTKRPSEVASSRDAKKQQQELTKEQEKLKSSIRFSMINVTPAGETAVGFTDSSDSKNPKNYYLRVGESRDGWTVKEADPVASSMTIVKGEVEVSLTIGGDSGKGAGKTSAAGAGVASGRLAASAGGNFGSLRARREQRRAEEKARLADFDKKMQEREAAFEKRQQEYQRQREEEKSRREEEKAQQDAQREEQRKQLMQIQEELKRAREEKEKAKEQDDASDT